MKRNFKLSLIAIALMFSHATFAQKKLTYQLPPQSIVDLIDAPAETSVNFSKDGRYMLLLDNPGFLSIEQVSQPVVGLAGLRINPLNTSNVAETTGLSSGLQLKDLKSNEIFTISGLPANLQLGQVRWNGAGTHFIFKNQTNDAVELWLVEVQSKQARKLFQGKLNDSYGTTYQWNPNGTHVLIQARVEQARLPEQNLVPSGPIVQENLGTVTPSRTYQYLLASAYDEQLMEYYLTSQLYEVSLSGETKKIANPAMYKQVAYSPDGQYILTQTIKKPYSYLVPIYQFPYETQLLDASGQLVKELSKTALAENLPISFDAVIEGPRRYEWRKDQPAELVWVEAKDQGNPSKNASIRDEVFTLKAPFSGTATKIFEAAYRVNNIIWADAQNALVQEIWRKDRSVKTSLINPTTGALKKLVAQRSSEDTYSDPGTFLLNNKGLLLVDQHKKDVIAFTKGLGASSEGDRPFLLKWNLTTNQQDTLFKSKAPFYEEPIFFNNNGKLYISKEGVDFTPNYFAVDLKNRKEEALTQFADPYPSMQGVQKSQLSYPRKDGIKLTATLYLPKDFKSGDAPLPALVWAYPREFKSLAAAGQVKGSPYRFTRLAFRSPVFWVTRGYAVLDQADMPIVGEGDQEPNDTFLEQIEENAVALINYVSDDLKVVDRKRIAVGGHSYGAFMTANLLAHTNLFAAGIARSGAYNRTLTPFGFQGESRTFWQAQDVYNKMSPFNFADKIKTPILLTHGMDDENSGTFPIQSERLYAAIKGHGGTVRLVLLPKEFHGYRSRESILHTFWEQDQWLEKYVKNKQ